MEKFYAIQWLNPQTDQYEVCQSLDKNEEAIAAIYFSKHVAEIELEDWLDGGEEYRMIEVILQEVT